MAWQDHRAPASFRGVEFWVDSDELTGGRDGESHQAPRSNGVPYVEDIGLQGRVFQVDAFLIGPDCLDQRNTLLTALELEGSGDLVHPTYGVRRVSVSSFSSRYSSKAQGLVTLSVTFAETSADPVFALDVLSPVGTVETAASAFRDASLAQFLAQYTTVPYSAEMQAQLSSLSQAVQQASSVKALSDEAAASLWRQTTSLAQDSAALLAAPATLALALRGVVATLAGGLKQATSGLSPLSAVLSLYAFPAGDRPDDSTPDGATAADSWDAMHSMVQREVLDQAAGIAAAQNYAAHEDAVAARTEVTDKIDSYCEGTLDDSYDKMTGLRRALCQAVPAPDETLPHIEEVRIPSAVPSLVMSYTLYHDLQHEEGIIQRNYVVDPTYLPGGVPLEVLSK